MVDSIVLKIFEALFYFNESILMWVLMSLAFFSVFYGVDRMFYDDDVKSLKKFWSYHFTLTIYLVAWPILLLSPLLVYLLSGYHSSQQEELWATYKLTLLSRWPLKLVTLTLGLVLGWLMGYYYENYFKPWYSKFRGKFVKDESYDLGSDIRNEQSVLNPKNFDPRKYYKDGYFFLGLDKDGQPVYESDDDFKKRNQKVIGPTQTGKGVLFGVQIDQAIRKGFGVFFFDPKPDDFVYDIMRETCADCGLPEPLVIDLNGEGVGVYNPFERGTIRERRSRMFYSFGLDDDGQQADFYKVKEREALDVLLKKWDGTIAHLQYLLDNSEPYIFEVTERTRGYVAEWINLRPVDGRPGEGIDIEKAIREGQVIYVRSSATDKLVKRVATVMLMEIVQTILRVGKQAQQTYIAVDELKFMVSEMLAAGLSTVISKGANFTVAYQSLSNLLNLEDKKLNADSIKSETEVNTKTTICYTAVDSETAKWASDLSGSVKRLQLADMEVSKNRFGAEKYDDDMKVKVEEANLVTPNQMLMLPERVSIIYRPNQVASFLYTCWIPVKEIKGIPMREEDDYERIDYANLEEDTVDAVGANLPKGDVAKVKITLDDAPNEQIQETVATASANDASNTLVDDEDLLELSVAQKAKALDEKRKAFKYDKGHKQSDLDNANDSKEQLEQDVRSEPALKVVGADNGSGGLSLNNMNIQLQGAATHSAYENTEAVQNNTQETTTEVKTVSQSVTANKSQQTTKQTSRQASQKSSNQSVANKKTTEAKPNEKKLEQVEDMLSFIQQASNRKKK